MKIFKPSDTYLNDSTEYKLVNMLGGVLMRDQKMLYLTYMHGNQMAEGEVTYQNIDKVHRGLSKTIVSIFNQSSDISEATRQVKATCSHLLGSYINLTTVDGSKRTFPFITNIYRVRQSEEPTVFFIDGLFYRKVHKNEHGIRMIVLDTAHSLAVTSEVIEKLWPGSSKAIPVMNALDYADYDIVKTLLEGKLTIEDVAASALPTFT